MADYKNIPLGLRTQTQIPLDVKEYIQNESLLSNLGVNGQLAYTYTKGLVVYCIEESTRWEWTEVKPGLEDTGLINQDFIYSDNHIAFGIDYSNKRYNFVKVEAVVIEPPFQKIDEGSGEGIIIRGRNQDNFGNVGFGAIDFSKSNSSSLVYGAKAFFSAIVNGQIQEITTISEASIIGAGYRNYINAKLSGIFAGSNNTIDGYGGGGAYFIGAGYGNTISESTLYGVSSILNGNLGTVLSYYATILNGNQNNITDTGAFGVILGGDGNTVSGFQGLVANGFSNKASGPGSSVINGSFCDAKGTGSLVLNGNNIADSYVEIVGGSFGTAYTPISRTIFNINDRIFNIGIGPDEDSRKDGLSLFKNGVATLPTVTNALITAASGKVIITKEYLESLENKQKIITYPADFTGTNYTLTNADNNYEIIVNNGSTAVSITVPSGLTSKIGVGFTQKGTGDISFTASGTTINNPVGLKIKGQYYQTYLSQESSTNIYYLGGNTKV